MRVPFSFLTEQFSDPEPIFSKVRDFLKRCDFTLGEDLDVFEKRYAKFVGVEHAIGVGTGTDALFLSLRALGVGPGDEVITAPNSFIATTGAIVQAGAKPVYVDVDDSLTVNPEAIESVIGPRTRAILPVHWAGGAAAMPRIVEIARRHHLVVVEDACQALGGAIAGKRVGSFGDAGAFSAHPLKPLHVWGDGGIITTNSTELAEKLRRLRNHGMVDRDTVAEFGYNSRFDNFHAIVGNHVFETLAETISRRQEHAAALDQALSAQEFRELIWIPRRPEGADHVFHLYQFFSPRREELLKFLQSNGIEAKVHYPIPLHLQPAAKAWGGAWGQHPMTERQSRQSLTLPCHQYLTSEHIDYMVRVLHRFLKEA